MAVLLITHDLGVVAERTDEIAVMYAGKIVESAKPDVIFSQPKHPYTIGLLNSLPGRRGTKKRLEAIPGMVPNPLLAAGSAIVARAQTRVAPSSSRADRDRGAPSRRLFQGCVRWRCSKSVT